MDPNTADYYNQRPLHIAAALGKIEMAKLLLDYGAAVSVEDRRGKTPLGEAKSEDMIKLLTDKTPKKCLVHLFPQRHDPEAQGVVLRVPLAIRTLIDKAAIRLLQFSDDCSIVSKEGSEITDVSVVAFIKEGQNLYLRIS